RVDIIAHTTIDPNPSIWSPALIAELVAKHISVVPTLQLWGYELAKASVPKEIVEKITREAETQLAAFVQAGGQVLFGTDAGYMQTLDPTEEYVRLAEAGLTPMQILAALTTAPAARWQATDRRGRVAEKLAADLVVVDGDPAADVRKFAAVKCTIRAGKPVFVR
ncbi:MAG: amidohydrolase family protein, partial [Kofleriaceae bacterium]